MPLLPISLFQVHQTKKANKFECKLCGEKQSIKRHYGLSTAKDCRLQVQKLNGLRAEINELEINKDDSDEEIENKLVDHKPNLGNLKPNTSKWSEYVDKTEEITETTHIETMYLNNTEVVLEVPKKTTKRAKCSNFKCPTKRHKVSANKCAEIHSGIENVFSNKILEPHIPPHERDFTKLFKTQTNDVILKTEPNVESSPPVTNKKEGPEKFVPTSVNSDSKWAQFVDTDVIQTNNISPLSSQTDNRSLFALCDDNELDNVLEI